MGLDNPQSSDPRHALFPYPEGCSGNRLMRMMQEAAPSFDRSAYVSIAKTNLWPIGPAPRAERRLKNMMAAGAMVEQLREQKVTVVLMGKEVAEAFYELLPGEMKVFRISGKPKFYWIPHPSGRNHYYNDKARRAKVGRFLVRRYYESVKEQTKNRT